ncbi:MAG: hypothetical protein WCT25_01290 [Candidatus Paceibacterota bacterium]|jgi:hypothetical protein
MPRALKTDRFFLQKAARSGKNKDKLLVGVHSSHKDITLQNLLDFLEANQIDPSQVELKFGFVTTVNPKNGKGENEKS